MLWMLKTLGGGGGNSTLTKLGAAGGQIAHTFGLSVCKQSQGENGGSSLPEGETDTYIDPSAPLFVHPHTTPGGAHAHVSIHKRNLFLWLATL